MYFIGSVTLSIANNSLTECLITMEILHNFFLDPEVIISLDTMFINSSTKEFTHMHLVTYFFKFKHPNEVLLRL